MKVDWAFLRMVLVLYAILTGVTLFFLSRYAESEHLESVVAGVFLSAANFLLGFLAIEYAFEKSHTTFLKVILGGMAARLLAMVGVVVVLIMVYQFHSLTLMLSLLGFYAVNLTLETFFLQKKVSTKNKTESA